MRYEDFKQTWTNALTDSGLPTIGWPKESLDITSMSRSYWVAVEPYGGSDAEPFHVSGVLEFTWDALLTARTGTREEDVLVELLGREDADGMDTEQPWLRVDVKLRASLQYGQGIPLPAASALRHWSHEVTERLERIEPLLPDNILEQAPGGEIAIRGWQGEPQLEVTCSPDGTLKLEGVKLNGWQAILLPRQWDDPDRHDDDPSEQVADMFARVKRALSAWMESLDHLTRAK